MSPSRKICTLEGLLKQREAARVAGRRVVQCHGCFDIVHPGHIHYLQFARRQGEVLIVSISADPQVNKGADRPLIPEEHRAAALAALECVDLVYVNPHPTAVELLEQVRPDVYVKGREYETNNDPRFIAEREAVTRHGGRVVFSSGDVIYSSTALIGGIGGLDAFNDEKVRRYRAQYDLRGGELMRLIESFRGRRVVVIGDYILDRYHFCEATSVAAEAPMMNLRQLRSEEYDGGAAVVALHLAGLGASAHLVTALSDKGIDGRLRRRGIMLDAIESRRDLAIKQRYLVDLTKVLKIDQGTSNAIDTSTEAVVAERIISAADGAAAAIFVDFGYGLITASLLERVLPELRRRVDVITADVSGIRSNLLSFKGVDLLCPTEREARETLHDFSSGINAVVWHLLSKTRAKQALITLGKQGLLVFDQHKQRDANESWERRLRSEYLPALANHAIDPLGCGDALLAAASLTLAAGGSIHAAAYLGSIAAACQARRSGNAPITLDEIFGLLGQMPAEALAREWRLAS
jgi:rfaE bifunctional protein kinase chain/domain/rfaE bifunctional protein nucleotidyltransferase chain/domain